MVKLFLLAFIFSFTLWSQPNRAQQTDTQIKVSTLSGRIKNYHDSLPKTISILVFDIAEGEQKNEVQEVNKNGDFTFKIDLYLPQDFYIKYNKQLSEILMEPGDSVFIEFEPNELCKTITFRNNNSTLNQQVRNFLNIFSDYWDKNGDVTSQVRKVDPQSYKLLVFKQQKTYDSLASKFVKDNKPSKYAEDWIKTYIKYRGGNDILKLFFFPEIKIPESYWDFVIKYQVENDDHFICSEYRLYLSTFNSDYFFRSNRLESALKAYKEKNYAQYLKTLTDSINLKYTGLSKDALLTESCFSILQKDYKTVDSLLSHSLIKIDSKLLLSQLQKGIDSYSIPSENQVSGLTFLNSNSRNDKGQFLTNLIQNKYKGKVVYVDFWATWCSPCLQEFPHSKLLHDKLSQLDIVFLYVCSDSEEKAWKKVIEHYNLKGDHILLNNDQFSYIRKEYQIPGFPTYLIFNKNGQLADKNAPRPSSNEIELILTGLLKK